MGNGYTTVTYDGVDYLVAEDGNPPGSMYIRAERCFECSLAFRRNQMKYFRGKWYGVPCGCFRDISSILKREDAHTRKERINRRRSNL